MAYNIAFCVFVAFVVAVSGKMSPTEPYPHSTTLKTGNIEVYWKFNETHITFEVHGETTGWIGIGFSPNGAMTGADIFIGWVKNNEVKVTDRRGPKHGNGFPPLDPQQDIDVLGGAECDGWTMFKFSRQLAACEAEYDRDVSQNTQRLIYAWGNEDPVGDDVDWSNDYHGVQRGVESMHFLRPETAPTALPDGPTYQTYDIVMDKFEVPPIETYYNCMLFKVPQLSKKHHIVKFEPIIQEGNEQHVHHMLVHRCGDVLEDSKELRKSGECFRFGVGLLHFRTCATGIIMGWAVGAGPIFYPEEAGFSIGGEGDPVYIQIEIHYDNPLKKADIVDSSGIRFTYTETLRKHDVGVAEIGTEVRRDNTVIPPGAQNFLTVGHCTSRCWENRMAASGVEEINVFSVMLHSHLAGRSMKLRQIRDGVELPTPAFDDHYDFNYQEARYLQPYVTLKPTDHLLVECMYSTINRSKITQGGLGTRDEMCLAFLFYYPKIDFDHCLSSVPYGGVERLLWSLEMENLTTHEEMCIAFLKYSPAWLDFKFCMSYILPEYMPDYMWDLNGLNWTAERIQAFETNFNSMLHQERCGWLNGFEKYQFNATEISSPYIGPQETCEEPYLPLSQKTLVDECKISDDNNSRLT